MPEETRKGQFTQWMLADFCILDPDIHSIPENELHGVSVTATIVGGSVAAGSC